MRFPCLSSSEVTIRGIREKEGFYDFDFYLPSGEASKPDYYKLGRNVLKGHWAASSGIVGWRKAGCFSTSRGKPNKQDQC